MRVLMVSHPLPGGPEGLNRNAPIARQIRSLQDIDVEVDVLTLGGGGKLKYARAFPKLQQMSKKVDIVHAHYGFVGWLARLQLSAPTLVSFMGSDLKGITNENGNLKFGSKLEIRSNKILAGLVNGIIVKSQEMAEVLSRHQAYVLPNGVDTDFFRPDSKQEARRKLGWSSDESYVLFPANASETHKNFAMAEKAIQHADAILGKKINLIPFSNFSHDKIPLYMNASDAFIFTSISEGSPNVIKEAMACDLPGVSVPVGDVADNLQGVSGYRICPRDPKLLANALVSLLQETYEIRGRATIEELGLDLASVAHRLLSIYQEIIH